MTFFVKSLGLPARRHCILCETSNCCLFVKRNNESETSPLLVLTEMVKLTQYKLCC